MADIALSYGDLRGVVSNLRYVAQQFEGSDDTSEAAATAVGHEYLAEQLREFADNWDDRREDFQKSAAALANTIDAIVDNFEDLDACMVDDG